LPGGRVLVVGGSKGGQPLTSAELYDPGTGKFTLTGSMAEPREGPTATLLPSGRVLVAGGYGTVALLASAEIYDPATGKFTPTGSMSRGRIEHTAASLSDGRVLIAGGYASDLTTDALASAEIYDPATGKFTSAGSMAQARIGHTATSLPDGRILIAGGTASSEAEIYDPTAAVFGSAGSMSQARSDPTATLLSDGRVLIAGGYGQAAGHSIASVELWEP
jgi:hypothetical protein